ncbi:hypothetical protein SAMN05443572_101597 [Myxococcus fulvus]|uniref:DUF2914 domain-containing protein n=1 Tax=Myxococcus fulvus TaxID=33 RepID=A0A511SZR6_MYXFU|nr:hypothetical protein [Myxococcus fulvus]GEN07385.1 hypothetical protein MFU01_24220 [Myxococcus fulvus]SES92757.1 hypothetical protein SAMN05443572_101597 [Myxococcus fulvus]
MKKLMTRTMVCAVLGMSSLALAQDAAAEAPAKEPAKVPSADAVRDTWNFFYNGKGQGPVLVEAKLCTEVAKDGPNKYECIAEVAAEGIKANTTVMLWQAYLVPQGDSVEDVMVQTKQGNVVRETKDVKLKGDGWRARQWTGVRLNKPGTWTVSVMRGDQVLKELQVKVN